jgi:predicted Zn-dependent protease with MMP-like domain/cytochrome c-type biogenesis protein CcmH/NrfG
MLTAATPDGFRTMADETNTPNRMERIHELLEEGRLDEALEQAEGLLASAPESAEAHCLVGMVRAQRGEVDAALAALERALTLEPKLTSARLEKARVLYDEARFEDVIEALRDERSVEALYLAASALFELGEHEEAGEVCERALALEELPELRHLEALLRLQRAEPEEALAAARRSIELDRELAEGHHALGLSYAQLGRIEEADAAFARAAELDPESYFRPFRLGPEDFDEVVDEALAELPEEFESYLDNVEIAVEDVPDASLLKEGLEFDLLGLYRGGTIQSEGWDFPDRVLLFQRNLENISPTRERLIEEIRDTVYHEIGHHMGMDEEAVRAAEDRLEEEDGFS